MAFEAERLSAGMGSFLFTHSSRRLRRGLTQAFCLATMSDAGRKRKSAPQETPFAAAPSGWLSQHQNRWSAHPGAKFKVDQRPQRHLKCHFTRESRHRSEARAYRS